MGVTLDNLPQSWVMGSKQVGIILLKVRKKVIRKQLEMLLWNSYLSMSHST